MEQSLGKRIVSHRKRLGFTQDQLAEKLGVTAQAVSKWENDQSCPDITMLPRLADIFGISADELLGMESRQTVHRAEVVTPENEDPRKRHSGGKWEFQYDAGRRGHIGIALWVLLTGGLLLISNLLHWEAGFWEILWPGGLLVFGLFGLVPKFSFFRLGCACFGGWFLLDNLGFAPFAMGKELLFPAGILLFGLSLLADGLGKNKKPSVRFLHVNSDRDGEEKKRTTTLEQQGEAFCCSTSFGEDTHVIDLPRLAQGEASVRFGELTVDLSHCREVADDCQIRAECAFGELTVLVPRYFRVVPDSHSSFASLEVSGEPDPAARGIIRMECNASFGEIEICYI